EPVKPTPAPMAAAPARPSVVQPRGRNLSAPSRLRIVETPATPPPLPVQRPRPKPLGARTATAKPGVAGPRVAGWAESEDAKKKEAAKKKPAAQKLAEPGRVTKKDLLGMMEEVEITRPIGRRSKRPTARARVERRSTQITTPGATKRKIKVE